MLDFLRVLVRYLVEYLIFNQNLSICSSFYGLNEEGFYQFGFSISVMIIFLCLWTCISFSFGPRNEAETRGEGQGQQQQQQQQAAHQREAVEWRFQIAFQLDLFLILKLAAVVFLFHQDGSKQRLALLVFSATMIYLYQTGAVQPFVQWISRVMHRAAAPPRPQRHVVGADNDPAAAARPLNDDVAPAEGQVREENEAENRANANENENMLGPEAGNQWWGIVKEIQMIVFGFITSLFPGFHNID